MAASVPHKNKNLQSMPSDFLYHLGINIPDTRNTSEIESKFGDVKFVCMGGTRERMEAFATYIRDLIDPNRKTCRIVDLSAHAHRFAMYKVGPVLMCSHGMGMPSMSILIHELIKLVRYAKCKDPVFIRTGTCGGVGVVPGTVVITRDVYNGYLRNEYEIAILGKKCVRAPRFSDEVVNDLIKCREPSDRYEITIGNTMCTDCFYEGQGRLDGACCSYTNDDKMAFLKKCQEHGIKNIEMETMFSTLTSINDIKAGAVCVAILNRLNGDQVTLTPEQFVDFEARPMVIVGRFIKTRIVTPL